VRGFAAGEFSDRQAVQAQPQEIVGFVGVLRDFLEFVEHMAVQETDQGPLAPPAPFS
jgi:hypothetical protein